MNITITNLYTVTNFITLTNWAACPPVPTTRATVTELDKNIAGVGSTLAKRIKAYLDNRGFVRP